MKTLILFAALLCSLYGFSASGPETEKPGQISGTVIDKKLQSPIPYATVVVKTPAGKIITGGITSEAGKFEISDIPNGISTVAVQFVGYKTYTTQIEIEKGNKNIDLGTIYLEENVAALDEVVITAERTTIEQKIDRKVIHVGKDLTTSGATASDIMNKLPSVSVDQQSGAVSLRGNSNVRVMVDGKLSNVPAEQLLKQIPSTSIKTIELITNPSAKYNPEGMSGIINIILYKNTQMGFNGGVSAGLTVAEHAQFNGTVDLNYRNGKFNFYGSYGANIEKNSNDGHIYRPDNNSLQKIDFTYDNESHLFKVGLDYYLNEKNVLSFFTNQNFYNGGDKGGISIFFEDDPSLNQAKLLDLQDESLSSQYNFDYLLKFDEDGHEIELEADYNVYDSEDNSKFRFTGASLLPNYSDFEDTQRDRLTVNLDYVNPLNETTKLETGLQAHLFDSNIKFASTGLSYNANGELVPTPSTDFDYKRAIYSAYAVYSKEVGKWGFQTGLRAETVEVAADTNQVRAFENNYFELYPSAYVTYDPSDKNSYQLSYSRRVGRPGLNQVNPIRDFTSPLISKFGNPNLQPQFTHSMEANYTRNLKEGSITGSVFYRSTQNDISQGFFIDRVNLNRVILTNLNLDDVSSYGFELSGNYRPVKWWDFNANFGLYSSTHTGIIETFNNSDDTPSVDDIVTRVNEVENVFYSIKTNHNFDLTEKLTFSVFGMYRGEQQGVQFTIEPMYFVNLGARYSFWDGDATLSLNYNDVFQTFNTNLRGEYPYLQIGEFNWESNTVYVGFSYRFGGEKYRAKSRKNREDNIKSGGGMF